MTQFSKEQLSFVEEIPKQIEIECPICLNILSEPHLVDCCGHNFCESCIERVKASNGPCPICNKGGFKAMINRGHFRIINGLQVYCTNKEKDCQWKGELRNLSKHLNKGEREGECQHEVVKCRHEKCNKKGQRQYLKYYEDNKCPQRPFGCQYCNEEGTYHSITEEHYQICLQHPVPCPNQCTLNDMPHDSDTDHVNVMPRGSVTHHVDNECPLQPVDCVFSWAGCKERPLRKDIELHTTDTKHMMLLAVACGELKKENEKVKQETALVRGELKKENEKVKQEMVPTCEDLKKENEKVKQEMGELKRKIKEVKNENRKLKVELGEMDAQIYSLHSATKLELQTLPVSLQVELRSSSSEVIHFYTKKHGQYFSARLFQIRSSQKWYLSLAFHHGIYDRYKQTEPQIFARTTGGKIIPLIEDAKKLVRSDVYILENIRPEKILSDPAVLTVEIPSLILSRCIELLIPKHS